MKTFNSLRHSGSLKTNVLRAFGVFFIIATLITVVSYIVTVQSYEADSHNAETHVAHSEYKKLFTEVIKICSVDITRTERHNEACKDVKGALDSLASIQDLGAQQTMATATRGILVASWFQVMVAAYSLALVGAALYATWLTLQQAADTSEAAWEALGEAKKSTQAAFKSLEITRDANRGVMVASTVKYFAQRTVGRTDHELHFTIKNIGNGFTVCESVTVGIKETISEIGFYIDPTVETVETISNIEIYPSAQTRHKKRIFDLKLPHLPTSIAKNRLFCWCVINYRDGYGANWVSTSTFSRGDPSSGEMRFQKHDFIDTVCTGNTKEKKMKLAGLKGLW